jgi:hypothetical protein
MPRLSHSTIALFIIACLVTSLHGWLRVADLAGYSPPPAVSRLMLRDVLDRQQVLATEMEAARERRRRAKELATAVVEERLTLREGAARLGELYHAAADIPWVEVERRFPGASEEECCCRLLIGEVALLGHERDQAREAARRLEDQLASELRRDPPSL